MAEFITTDKEQADRDAAALRDENARLRLEIEYWEETERLQHVAMLPFEKSWRESTGASEDVFPGLVTLLGWLADRDRQLDARMTKALRLMSTRHDEFYDRCALCNGDSHRNSSRVIDHARDCLLAPKEGGGE